MDGDTPASTAGVDWATDGNELCIVDHAGASVLRRNTACDAAGVAQLVRELERHSVARVAIERPDGPVVDALLAAGLQVVVIPPRQVKHLRSRYGSAGNKDDRFDALVLADTLRTDGHRLTPLQPDSAQTVALRSVVRARTDLVETRVALCNRLRAHLRVVFPAVAGVLADLDSPINLAFLTRFPTPDKAARLSERRLGAWLAANGYCGRQPARLLLARLQSGPHGLTGDPVPPPRTPRCTQTPTSSSPCPAPAPCAPPSCWSKSATHADPSPPKPPSPPSPAPARPPASRANTTS